MTTADHLRHYIYEREHRTVAIFTPDGRSSCGVLMPVHVLEDALNEIEGPRDGDEEMVYLVALVRRLMKAIQYVPFRPCDCNQNEVYECIDRINVILDTPGSEESKCALGSVERGE